jgi:putative peptidoglycan lipid II flippase
MIKQQSLKKAVVSTSILNLISKILGYAKTIILIVFAGMGDALDAYIVAYSVVTVYIMMFGDIFDSLGVPELSRAWSEKKEKLFNSITKNLFFLSFVLTIILSSALYFTYHYFLNIQAIGFSAEKRELVVNMLYYLIPMIVVYLPYHALGAFFRSQKYLTFFYTTQLVNSIVVLGYLAVNHDDPYDIPIATSLGFISGFILMLFFAFSRFSLFGKIDFAYYKSIAKTFIPLFFILGTFQMYNVTDRAFASYLNSGAISAMYYALMLTMIVPGMLSLSNLIIADLTLSKDPTVLINKLFYFGIYVSIPVIVFVVTQKELIVDVILNFGNLSVQNYNDAVTSLGLYILILPSLMIWPILYRYFQIIGKLKVIFAISSSGVLFNILLNYLFMFWFNMGLAGLIIATIINHIYSNTFIIGYANIKLKINIYLGEIIKRLIVVLLVSSMAGIFIYFINMKNEIVELVIKGCLYLVLLGLGFMMMKFKELEQFKKKLVK